MKKTMIAFGITALLFACNSEQKTETSTVDNKADSIPASTAAKSADWIPVDSATAMNTMMEMGTPGEEHKMLATADGKWSAETTMWIAPDAPPAKGKATATNTMILGGRYQQTSFKGDFMGMPFEGGGVTGYDKARKVYFTNWMDNMSTMMMTMDGKWNAANKSIEFKGKMLCPANGIECSMREVYTFVDDNTQLIEWYGPDMKTGKEYKNMEIRLNRMK